MFQVNSMQVFNNFSLTLSVRSLKSVTKQPAKTVFSLHSSLFTPHRQEHPAEETPVPQQQRFHSDDKKSVWNLVGSLDWLKHQLYKPLFVLL